MGSFLSPVRHYPSALVDCTRNHSIWGGSAEMPQWLPGRPIPDELHAKHIQTLGQGGTTKTEVFVDTMLRTIGLDFLTRVSEYSPSEAAWALAASSTPRPTNLFQR